MIEHLRWDSGFFGVGVGRVDKPVDSSRRLDELLEELKGCSESLVYARLPLGAMDLITRLTGVKGAVLTDLRAELDLDLSNLPATEAAPSGIVIRLTRGSDAAKAGELASSCYRGTTRFYRDPRIGYDRCDLFYRTWTESDILSEDRVSLVCMMGEELMGFCTSGPAGTGEARLGLIGMSPGARGRGTGGMLLEELARRLRERGFERLIAVTQLDNTGAMRMYGKTGFLLRGTAAVVHLWRNGPGA